MYATVHDPTRAGEVLDDLSWRKRWQAATPAWCHAGAYLGFCRGECTFLADLHPPPRYFSNVALHWSSRRVGRGGDARASPLGPCTRYVPGRRYLHGCGGGVSLRPHGDHDVRREPLSCLQIVFAETIFFTRKDYLKILGKDLPILPVKN